MIDSLPRKMSMNGEIPGGCPRSGEIQFVVDCEDFVNLPCLEICSKATGLPPQKVGSIAATLIGGNEDLVQAGKRVAEEMVAVRPVTKTRKKPKVQSGEEDKIETIALRMQQAGRTPQEIGAVVKKLTEEH